MLGSGGPSSHWIAGSYDDAISNSRVHSHPSRPVFSDDVYLDGTGCRSFASCPVLSVSGIKRAVYRDGLTSMEQFVPDGDEVRGVGREGGRAGVFAERLLDDLYVSVGN